MIYERRQYTMSWATILVASFFIIGCNEPAIHSWALEKSSFSLYPIRVDQGYVLGAKNNEKEDCLCLIDEKTGLSKWCIKDNAFSSLYYNLTSYVHNNVLVLPNNKTIFFIDLDNGKVLKKVSDSLVSENHIYGLKEMAFRTRYNLEEKSAEVVSYNLESMETEVKWSIPINNISTSLIRSPVPFKINNESFLITNSIDFDSGDSTLSNYHVLNIETKESWQNENYPFNKMGEGGANSPLVEQEYSYWLIEKLLVKYNHITDKRIWEQLLPHGILTSRIEMDDEFVYVPCEDEFLYCISKSQGKIKWKTKTAGTPSRLFIDDSYIHIIGGSDRILYEVDKSNGKILNEFSFVNSSQLLQRESYFHQQSALISDENYWYSLDLHQNELLIKQNEK